MAGQFKRIQIRNVLEEKSLQEKIRLFSKEQSHVDKELRQILHAKESLLQSLRKANLGIGRQELKKADTKQEKIRKSESKVNSDDRAKSVPRRQSVQVQSKKKHDTQLVQDGSTQTIEHPLPVNSKQRQTINSTDKPEIKSCFRANKKHTQRSTHVHFAFPEIKSKKNIENKEGKSCDDADGKVFRPRERQYVYKSHSDCLDEIQVKSKFFQIGSVALATAIFKSNSLQNKTDHSNRDCHVMKESNLKNEERKSTTQVQTKPKKPLRRVKSGCSSVQPSGKKLLVRRQSMLF